MLLYRKISLTFCPDVPRNLKDKGSADCGLGAGEEAITATPPTDYLRSHLAMPGGPSAALPPPRLTFPGLVPSLPYSINGGLVRVGDQLERGVGSGQWEHAGVQGLLRERIVGWIKFSWHHIHGYRGLEGTRQGELTGLKKPHLLPQPPYLPLPIQQQLHRLNSHCPASPQAAYAQLQKDLVQHFDCLHTGCLGFLGEVFGLGEEAQDMVRSTVRLTRGRDTQSPPGPLTLRKAKASNR